MSDTTTQPELDELEEPVPTRRQQLDEIKIRIMEAQDAVGWANQDPTEEFNEIIARSVVEYGRCMRDLAGFVQALLPEET